MSNRPVHFEIHASDPAKSVAYYAALFGWRFEKVPMPGVYYSIVTGDDASPGINGGLLQRMGPAPAEGAPVSCWCVTVAVENVDMMMAKARELGGAEALPKMAIPNVGYVAYFKDIDGNIVGLHQADTGAR